MNDEQQYDQAYEFSENGEKLCNDAFRKLARDARRRGITPERFEKVIIPELLGLCKRVRRLLGL